MHLKSAYCDKIDVLAVMAEAINILVTFDLSNNLDDKVGDAISSNQRYLKRLCGCNVS